MQKTENKLPIALLIALVGFGQLSETIYTPALPNVASELNASAHMVEQTLAIYFIGFAIGVLLWGTISDFFGRRNAMLTGIIVYTTGTFGCALATGVETLLAWRLLQAFGASVGSVVTQTILRDTYNGAARIQLFSLLSGALAFSPAIGPLLGGTISQFLGWRANFWILTLLSIILILWTYFFLRETRPKQQLKPSLTTFFSLLLTMITSCILWGHILLIAATNALLFGFYQEAPFVFIQQLGMQPKFYGFFGILIASASIIAARISYRLSAQTLPTTLIGYGAVSILLGALMLTTAVVTEVFQIENMTIAVSVIPLFLLFFGIGLIIPNSLSLALKPYQHSAGTAGSIFGACYYFLIALCTYLMSVAHDDSPLPLALYMTLLGIVVVIGHQMCCRQPPKTTIKRIMIDNH